MLYLCGMENTPLIPRVSQEQYNSMTDEQKRIYLIQIKQEETMTWQLMSAKIHVYSAVAVGVIAFILLLIKFN